MTQGNSLQQEEIKKYLFDELTPAEREKIEEKLFEDSNYFYDVLNMENDLVDKYALSQLEGDELERFEKSLKASPERREKVATAVALQCCIAEERQTESLPEKSFITKTAKVSFWTQVSNFFSFRPPSFQYAVVGLIILLTAGIFFLLIDRLKVGQELAKLRENHGGTESQLREQALQEKIKAAQEREAELKRQIESERGESEVLNKQLERETSERKRIERELEELRQAQSNQPSPLSPTIASIFLSSRGRGSGSVKEMIVGTNTKRIIIRLELEEGIRLEGRLSVEINDQTVATNLQPRSLYTGKKFITVSVSPQRVVNGVNKVVVKNEEDLPIGDYELKVRKR